MKSLNFFEHIGAKITNLANAYKNALDDFQDMGKQKIPASNVNYTILLNRLNRAINDFKREMTLSLQDYYMIMDVGEVSHNVAKHIECKLKELYDEYTRFGDIISEDIIKQGLGKNYYFHKNLKKLTVESILDYFETNYILHMENINP